MRDKERFEEEMEYMKRNKWIITAVVVLIYIVIKMKTAFTKLIGGKNE